MSYHLAQVNIAKIKAPLDSLVMADFVNNLDRINTLAESSPGFVWRLKDGDDATTIRMYDDDYLVVNMSVWQDLDHLKKFVYQSEHLGIFKRKGEWFENMEKMHMALWYVQDGNYPSVEEAEERLNHLRTHGETPYSFSFRKIFPAPDHPSGENG